VLAGGYFIVHHVDVTVGEQPVRAIEVIGEPDPAGGEYLARRFDSEGNAELMHVTIDEDGVFHFAGGADIAPTAQPTDAPTARVRSTLTIAKDRRSMTASGNDPKTASAGIPGWTFPSREATDRLRVRSGVVARQTLVATKPSRAGASSRCQA
jgi:hypothetical protein